MAIPKFGRVQLQIMKVLWQQGRVTARDITSALQEQMDIAHSTVQTLLRKLETKEAVAHDVEERTFFFYPLVTEEQVTQSATHDLLSRVFDGSAYGLVACLVRNENLTSTELDQIRQLIHTGEDE